MKKRLPIGIENFSEFFSENFYYVDKTGLIIDLLRNWGKVNLFTRPRRFGKSLNMSMLKSFFEDGCDGSLFKGLKISQERELCNEYMGRFPVISITLKGANGRSFQGAKDSLKYIIGTEAGRFSFLKSSDKLTEEDKSSYYPLINIGNDGNYIMSDETLETGLKTLSSLLYKHYGRKTIILIDEYDVPLDKAYDEGYYDEMISLIRNLLGNVLKTNDSLQFAVLTGCLRISKESIFTGLNNLKVHTITDVRYEEYFGFTDNDVKALLEYYDLSDHFNTVKEWYDGYKFGKASVYCPWDVINYCDSLLADETSEPQNFWSNTSGNSIVRKFIDLADQQTRDDIEQLIAGNTINKEIKEELTYRDVGSTIDNLWSVLLSTGYLTARERVSGSTYKLAIPNYEITSLFSSQVKEWFKERTADNPQRLNAFCNAFSEGNAEYIQNELTSYLKQTISIRDTYSRTGRKEHFYHGFLLGLLSSCGSWSIKSNEETGDGFGDIVIRDPSSDTGIIIEVKYAEDGSFDTACNRAVEQIKQKNYEDGLKDNGIKTIRKYGIAFYKKQCRVISGK